MHWEKVCIILTGFVMLFCTLFSSIAIKSILCTCHNDVILLCLFQPNGNCVSDGHGLVTIRMKPDDHGRFGFNVKVRQCCWISSPQLAICCCCFSGGILVQNLWAERGVVWQETHLCRDSVWHYMVERRKIHAVALHWTSQSRCQRGHDDTVSVVARVALIKACRLSCHGWHQKRRLTWPSHASMKGTRYSTSTAVMSRSIHMNRWTPEFLFGFEVQLHDLQLSYFVLGSLWLLFWDHFNPHSSFGIIFLIVVWRSFYSSLLFGDHF